MTSDAARPPYDALECCLRAVLAFHERGMSSASLRSRVAHGEGLWSEDTLIEAADSLGIRRFCQSWPWWLR